MDLGTAVQPPTAAQVQKLDRDWGLAALAERQHRTVSRRQLIEVGFTRHTIMDLVTRRYLHLVHRGVYAVGPGRLTREGRWMAAVLAAGPSAALSHRSAAALRQLIRDDGGEVDVTVSRSRRKRPGVHARSADLPVDEITIVDGIPVTTVPRTILDLAAVLPRWRVEKVIHEAEIQRLADFAALHALIARYPRRRGLGTLKAILAEHLGPTITRSDFEDLFIAFLSDNDLPRPLVNHYVAVAGECDFVWPDQRVIVELDGYATHGTREQFEKDRARDRALQVGGWRVIRITWRQLRDEPGRLANDLRALLGSAS